MLARLPMYFDVSTFARLFAVSNDPRHFHLPRTALMDTLFGVWSAVHAVNYLGEKVDEIRHPDFHDVDVGAPIYIVAAPRSGTTFFHRLMAQDPQFATFTLYQTIFSTVTASEVTAWASELGIVAKLADLIGKNIDKSFDGWEGMHDTGLGSDEEDEAVWALLMATPAVLLLTPFPEAFEHLRFIDRLPETKKRRFADSYRDILKRRLHREPGKTLLMKNVLLPGRYETVMRAAPRSRFVHIVRHPYESIPSALSLFTLPWTVLAPEAHGQTAQTRDMADLLIDYYRFFFDREREAVAKGSNRFVSVRYDELVDAPMAAVERVYDQFGLGWSPGHEERFRAALRGHEEYRSTHTYSLEQFGLSKEYLQERLGDVMDHYGFER